MVKADQQTLDPCEEENDDLPLAIVTHLEKKRSTGRCHHLFLLHEASETEDHS